MNSALLVFIEGQQIPRKSLSSLDKAGRGAEGTLTEIFCAGTTRIVRNVGTVPSLQLALQAAGDMRAIDVRYTSLLAILNNPVGRVQARTTYVHTPAARLAHGKRPPRTQLQPVL